MDAILDLAADGGVGYFTGLTHSKTHEEIEEWIGEQETRRGITVKCAFDGLLLSVPGMH